MLKLSSARGQHYYKVSFQVWLGSFHYVPVHNRALLLLQRLLFQRFLILSKKNDRPSIEKSSAFSKLPKLRLFWLPTSKVNAFKLQNLERGENESENILSKWKTGKFRTIFSNVHGVWKSQKKSHSTLRAKRATFRFWVDKSSLKMPKNGQFWRIFENLKLAVKQSYQTGQF